MDVREVSEPEKMSLNGQIVIRKSFGFVKLYKEMKSRKYGENNWYVMVDTKQNKTKCNAKKF